MSESRKITRSQELQLIGLMTLAETHNAALRDIESAALAITGEDREGSGHTSDAVYGSRSVQELLGVLGISVEVTE